MGLLLGAIPIPGNVCEMLSLLCCSRLSVWCVAEALYSWAWQCIWYHQWHANFPTRLGLCDVGPKDNFVGPNQNVPSPHKRLNPAGQAIWTCNSAGPSDEVGGNRMWDALGGGRQRCQRRRQGSAWTNNHNAGKQRKKTASNEFYAKTWSQQNISTSSIRDNSARHKCIDVWLVHLPADAVVTALGANPMTWLALSCSCRDIALQRRTWDRDTRTPIWDRDTGRDRDWNRDRDQDRDQGQNSRT